MTDKEGGSTIHDPTKAKAIVATTKAQKLDLSLGSPPLEAKPDPCIIVILGASGDLTARKLMPALYNLFVRGCLPDPVVILGASRTELSEERFREKMLEGLSAGDSLDLAKWERFSSILHYHPLQYAEPSSYRDLASFIEELDQRYQTQGNRMFYLAIPPSLYENSSQMLGAAGLSTEGPAARGEFVEQDAEREDVATAVDGLPPQLLG